MVTIVTPARHRSVLHSTYTRTDLPGTFVHANVDNSSNLPVGDSRTTNYSQSWRQVIARGGDASTAYEVKTHKYLHLRGFARTSGIASLGPPIVRFEGNMSLYYYLLDYTAQLQDADDTVLRDMALARLKRKLARHNASTNVLVPMAELHEMRGFISASAKLATSFLHELLRIKRTKGRSALKYASDAWLNFSFGVSPLVDSTKAIAESIAAYLDHTDHNVVLTGSASKRWVSGSTPSASTGAFGADIYTSCRVVHDLSYRYTSGFSIAVKSGNNYGVGSQFGLEFGALIPTFWELVPYSWVVDYFTNVGAFLDDTFTTPSGSTKYVVLNRRYNARMDVDGELRPAVKSTSVEQYLRPGFYDYFHFTRTPLSSLPHQSLRFKTSDEVGLFAVNKLLNLSALLIKKG